MKKPKQSSVVDLASMTPAKRRKAIAALLYAMGDWRTRDNALVEKSPAVAPVQG